MKLPARTVLGSAPLWWRCIAHVSRLFPLLIAAACLWAIARQVTGDTLAAVPGLLGDIPPSAWAAALFATGLSFYALARYDIALHRYLRTGLDDPRAGRVGAASIALSQTLGMGVVTGALVRWKLLDELTPGQAAKLSFGVAVSFLFGWACITSLICILVPPPGITRIISSGALLFCLTTIALMFARPIWRWRCHVVHMPSMPLLGAILGWALIDTMAACVAFAILVPDAAALSFAALLPAFLLALGAGLLTGSPGGVGPFELCLLALLPHVSEPALLTGILAFRMIYYALPAGLAVLYLVYRHLQPASAPTPLRTKTTSPDPARDLGPDRACAEHALALQNGAQTLAAGSTRLAVIETPQTLTMLFDPLSGKATTGAATFRDTARSRGRLACVYKCSSRTAAQLRRLGLRALHITDEAVLSPPDFCLSSPRHRQLRRKLRQAERSNVTILRQSPERLEDLRNIDTAWQARTGPARGLSMGRFCTVHIARQRIYVAQQDGRPVAFVTWHHCDREWTLDLMRATPDAPNGTMHALVIAALEDARALGIDRLSLAGLPRPGADTLLGRIICRATANSGLTRFKTAFAPRREPRYALSTSYAALAISLIDIARAVRRPAPHPTQQHDENYEFAIAN